MLPLNRFITITVNRHTFADREYNTFGQNHLHYIEDTSKIMYPLFTSITKKNIKKKKACSYYHKKLINDEIKN